VSDYLEQFENPPKQHLAELREERARHVARIDALHDELFGQPLDDIWAWPDKSREIRGISINEVSAHELTVARIDREIAEIQAHLLHEEVVDNIRSRVHGQAEQR
jgi:hypothetical protein